MKQLLTTSQAAQQVGSTRRTLSKLCASGAIPATRQGRDYLIKQVDLAKHWEKRPKAGRRWPKPANK